MAKMNEEAAEQELPLNDERVKVQKKRQAKPGTRRVTINLSEDEYKGLVAVSQAQMREPNNMLSFMLAGKIVEMLAVYEE